MKSTLHAISPLDGRYHSQVEALSPLVSEFGLISYRIRIEARWLRHLIQSQKLNLPKRMPHEVKSILDDLSEPASLDAAQAVKKYEKITNHDVKAVEYFVRDTLQDAGADATVLSHIHFGCTSEDINNVAYAWMLEDLRKAHLLPAMDEIITQVTRMVDQYQDLSMLSRTHGQSATPTTLGKELAVFAWRLHRCRQQLAEIPILAKFSGAVGAYHAHEAAYPEVDWQEMSRSFIEDELGFVQNPWTTQIENHDWLIEYFDALRRFSVISLGLSRDFWSYVSLGYFKLKTVEHEVGSSTMPHKVNPIDFENAEGNLGLSISLCQHFAEKLPISRWQRDLSDSTVLRNIGSIAAYTIISLSSLRRGLHKVEADADRISVDLSRAPEVLSEAVQSVLRSLGIVDAYEQLKALSRATSMDLATLRQWIDQHPQLSPELKQRLMTLEPGKYIGQSAVLAQQWLNFHSKAREPVL